MEIVGFLSAILIGISLGLVGGGGSILTVPVLVYLFAIDSSVATSYSLFIVGITSAVGCIINIQNKLVNTKTAIIFGIPSIISVFITKYFIVPAIPNEVISVGNLTITKNTLTMILFALLMIAASYSMIKKNRTIIIESLALIQFNYLKVLIQGVVVGMLTGFMGAGGGFLIIPALVNMLKIPIKKAIGTSLLIITLNSFVGFIFSFSQTIINWGIVLKITAFAIIGIFIGIQLGKKINGAKLKPAFGWFVLVMGLFIILKELLFK
jgi:uncharacterized protein